MLRVSSLRAWPLQRIRRTGGAPAPTTDIAELLLSAAEAGKRRSLFVFLRQ